jgi:hypothetical protein
MEGQLTEMDVDQNAPSTPRELVLSPKELSELNKTMNSELEYLPFPDAEDRYMVAVVHRLLSLLSRTPKKELFHFFSDCRDVKNFMENLKDDELKELKEGILRCMKERDWRTLIMLRTSLPVAV